MAKSKKSKSGTGNQKAIFKVVGALLVVGVLTASVCCTGYASRDDAGKWFKNSDISTWHWADNSPADKDNKFEENSGRDSMVLSNVESNGLRLSRRLLSVAEYAENGIDGRLIKSAYTAVVNITNPTQATDKRIKLSVKFVTAPEWNDWLKTATEAKDYIQFSSGDIVEAGQEFTITCTKAFGAPILIEATTASYNPDVSDEYKGETCSIQADYVARFGGSMSITVGYDGDDRFDGTVDAGTPSNYFQLALSDGGPTEARSEYYNWLDYALDRTCGGCLNMFSMTCEYGVGTIKDEMISSMSDKWGVEIVVGQQGKTYEEVKRGYYVSLTDSNADAFVYNKNKFVYCGNFTDDWSHALDSAVSEYIGGYNEIAYHQQSYTLTMYVKFTGKLTGEDYLYAVDLRVNPKYMYVSATGPSFGINGGGSGNIIF